MAKAIFKVFFKVMKIILDIFLIPINALFVNFFPDFSGYITSWTNRIQFYLGGYLAYFLNFIPPATRNMLLLYFTILVSYYVITISAHAILKVIAIIKAIKVW